MRKELDVLYDETSILAAPMLIDEKGSDAFVVGNFHVPFGPAKRFMPKGFTLNAPTCQQNIFRQCIRACLFIYFQFIEVLLDFFCS